MYKLVQSVGIFYDAELFSFVSIMSRW